MIYISLFVDCPLCIHHYVTNLVHHWQIMCQPDTLIGLIPFVGHYHLYLMVLEVLVFADTPYLKSTKNQNRRAALGTASNELITGGGGGGGGLQIVCGRPTLALSSALVPRTLRSSVCVEDS